MAENFSWAAALDTGIGAASGLFNWLGNRGGSAQQIAAEGARKARNTVAASANSLAATVRYLNNQKLLEAAGREFNAASVNLGRQQDSAASRRFETSLRNSEADGARAATIAASGVGGGALAAVSIAAELQQGRMAYQSQVQDGQVTYNIAARMAGVMTDAVGSRDFSMIGGNVDTVSALGSTNDSALSLLTSVAAGVMEKKDSLQVLLGSMAPKTGTTQPQATEPFKIQSTAVPQPAFEVQSFPVNQSTITGVDLGPVGSTPKTLGGL